MDEVLEIELKFRVDDRQQLRQRIAELSGQSLGRRVDVDTYYRHPCRNFAETGEAFRIRRSDGVAWVTYKGPKSDSDVKTRKELEWSLAPSDPAGERFARLLEFLGFETVAVVRKQRETFQLRSNLPRPLLATVDEVEGVGVYAEVETMASPEEVQAGQETVRATAKRLGLLHVERRSYLRLVLELSGS